MITNIFLGCLPLSAPSLYLSYKIWRKDYLGTLLNQQMALMLLISGNYGNMLCRHKTLLCPFFSQNYIFEGLLLPFTLSLAILRLTLEWDSSLAELSHFSLEICALQRHLESTFLDTWLYMNSGSVLFR